MELMKKVNTKKIAAVVIACIIAVFSATVLTDVASDPNTHKKTIAALDEKKKDVLKFTAASAAASTAIAAIPGDATTPVANKLADLTSYFLIILMVIFLEKYLVTLTGYVTFSILIPAACALCVAGVCCEKSFLKILAAKIVMFGIVICMIIPISMNVSAKIEQTYEATVENTLEEAEDITGEIKKSTDSKGNIIEKALSKLKDGVTGLLEKGEKVLNQFIELIAVMLVTSCLIPIFIFAFMIWFVRTLFGLPINIPKDTTKRISAKMAAYRQVSSKSQDKTDE